MFWQHIDLTLSGSRLHDDAQINLVRRFGRYIRALRLCINQEEADARNYALKLLKLLSGDEDSSAGPDKKKFSLMKYHPYKR